MRSIKPLRDRDWGTAMCLAWKVFLKFEAVEYDLEGVENFYSFINDEILYKMFRQGVYRVFGCYQDEKSLLGIISLRGYNHISLLFVDERYHHQGIAAALMRYLCDYVLETGEQEFVTVNAAPYSIGFYHKMGFMDTGCEVTKDGISFTPMKFFL